MCSFVAEWIECLLQNMEVVGSNPPSPKCLRDFVKAVTTSKYLFKNGCFIVSPSARLQYRHILAGLTGLHSIKRAFSRQKHLPIFKFEELAFRFLVAVLNETKNNFFDPPELMKCLPRIETELRTT